MDYCFQKERNSIAMSRFRKNYRLLMSVFYIQILFLGVPKVLSFHSSLNKKNFRYESRKKSVQRVKDYINVNNRIEFSIHSENKDIDDDFTHIRRNSYFNELGSKSIKKAGSEEKESQSMKTLIKYFVPGFVAIWAAGYGAVFFAEISGDLIYWFAFFLITRRLLKESLSQKQYKSINISFDNENFYMQEIL